ncbi:MAG TPA: ABC transporter ATP-binding protein [Candidatus Nanopelagicaceae bacterium]|nr:ABC transporter ATP-binding protein [Candidatus Nanopelagicaceae bacterium]
MSLIKFNNFHFRYKGNDEYALKKINLEIGSNKFILLAGETGSGKTTLIRCMNGLIPQFYAGYYKGDVEISGKNTTETTISELSSEVGIVFQNPENQLITMNVEHEIAFGLENLGIPRDEIKEKIKEVVEITEIESIIDKAPFEISGGEQQRVAIASILVLEPRVIVLDEPTANLDPLFARKILNLLKKIQVEKKITVIISEHRMDLILPLVDDIILMKESEIIAYGAKDKVINSSTFENSNINKPKIYSIFNELKKRNKFQHDIPVSIQDAISSLKMIK